MKAFAFPARLRKTAATPAAGRPEPLWPGWLAAGGLLDRDIGCPLLALHIGPAQSFDPAQSQDLWKSPIAGWGGLQAAHRAA